VESVSKGGNLLLNVGPTARGVFDYRAQDRLKSMGEWMKYNSRSVYGCTAAPEGFTAPPNTLLTYNPVSNRLYIHLLAYPMGSLSLQNMGDKVKYVQFLHDASEVQFRSGREDTGNDITLNFPVLKPPVEIPVLEIFLR
jgi:alpha-L-fucosidase